jgi:hypothetical protein
LGIIRLLLYNLPQIFDGRLLDLTVPSLPTFRYGLEETPITALLEAGIITLLTTPHNTSSDATLPSNRNIRWPIRIFLEISPLPRAVSIYGHGYNGNNVGEILKEQDEVLDKDLKISLSLILLYFGCFV